MDQIFFIFIFFCILFLIERKAMNILICFVGIMITLAIQIAIGLQPDIIEGQYFSYILILVQVSALTILFGFIIMLYPILSFSNLSPYPLPFGKGRILLWSILSILILSILYNMEIDKNNWYFQLNDLFYSSSFNEDTLFLRKLGYYLYQNENNIIKLLLLTIILLFAIIALFFLI